MVSRPLASSSRKFPRHYQWHPSPSRRRRRSMCKAECQNEEPLAACPLKAMAPAVARGVPPVWIAQRLFARSGLKRGHSARPKDSTVAEMLLHSFAENPSSPFDPASCGFNRKPVLKRAVGVPGRMGGGCLGLPVRAYAESVLSTLFLTFPGGASGAEGPPFQRRPTCRWCPVLERRAGSGRTVRDH